MFVITLRFADKSKAPQLMNGHDAWLKSGFDDACSSWPKACIQPGGGLILAHGASRTAIETRIRAAPFVAEGTVSAEILAVAPGRTDERLALLKP